jgi:hypothetical protein
MTCPSKWEGKNTILVVVDSFFKLAKFEPIKTTTTTIDIVRLFFELWGKHSGMLEVTVNDCDGKFYFEILDFSYEES